MDMDIGKIGRGHWAKRCIQCGDMIDETILRNREVPLRTYQEIDPAADIGRSFDASPSHGGKGGRYASVSHASATIRSHTTLDHCHESLRDDRSGPPSVDGSACLERTKLPLDQIVADSVFSRLVSQRSSAVPK